MIMPGQGDPNDPNNPFGIPAGLLSSAATPGQPGAGMAQGLMQLAGQQGPKPGMGAAPPPQPQLAPAARPAQLPGPVGGSPTQNALFDGGAASLANPQTGTTLTRAIGEALQAGKASFVAHANQDADTKLLQQQVDAFRATLNNPKLAALLGDDTVETFQGMPVGQAMQALPQAIAAAKKAQSDAAIEKQRAEATTNAEAMRLAAVQPTEATIMSLPEGNLMRQAFIAAKQQMNPVTEAVILSLDPSNPIRQGYIAGRKAIAAAGRSVTGGSGETLPQEMNIGGVQAMYTYVKPTKSEPQGSYRMIPGTENTTKGNPPKAGSLEAMMTSLGVKIPGVATPAPAAGMVDAPAAAAPSGQAPAPAAAAPSGQAPAQQPPVLQDRTGRKYVVDPTTGRARYIEPPKS